MTDREFKHQPWCLLPAVLDKPRVLGVYCTCVDYGELGRLIEELAEPICCEDCGAPDATPGVCPYDEDVNNTQTAVVLCKTCYGLRGDEI